MTNITDLMQNFAANIQIEKRSQYNHLQEFMSRDEFRLIRQELDTFVTFKFAEIDNDFKDAIHTIKKDIFLTKFIIQYITLSNVQQLKEWCNEIENININWSIDKKQFETLFRIRQKYQNKEIVIKDIKPLDVFVHVLDANKNVIGKKYEVLDTNKIYHTHSDYLDKYSYNPAPQTKYSIK